MSLENQTVIIFGGGSGIGLASAHAVAKDGAKVTIVGRSQAKLDAASAAIGEGADAAALDFTDEAALTAFFERYPDKGVDHIVISASDAVHGKFMETPVSAIEGMIQSKLMGPYKVARHAVPKLADGGSITFFSGALSRRPSDYAAGLAAVNGAVEALTRALAKELAPAIRVNCICPGMTPTPAYDSMPAEMREGMFERAAKALPVQRLGRPEEVAQAVYLAVSNGFMTGATIDVDGGRMVA